MSEKEKYIYLPQLWSGEYAQLIKIKIKRETPKTFVFAQPINITEVIGNGIPAYLSGKVLHKKRQRWFHNFFDARSWLYRAALARVAMCQRQAMTAQQKADEIARWIEV